MAVVKAGYQRDSPPLPATTLSPRPTQRVVTTAAPGASAPKTKRESVYARAPEQAALRAALQQAHPGLTGRMLVRAVLGNLTKGLCHDIDKRDHPRRDASRGTSCPPADHPLRRERPRPCAAVPLEHHEDHEAAARWQRVQERFAALAAQESSSV